MTIKIGLISSEAFVRKIRAEKHFAMQQLRSIILAANMWNALNKRRFLGCRRPL